MKGIELARIKSYFIILTVISHSFYLTSCFFLFNLFSYVCLFVLLYVINLIDVFLAVDIRFIEYLFIFLRSILIQHMNNYFNKVREKL